MPQLPYRFTFLANLLLYWHNHIRLLRSGCQKGIGKQWLDQDLQAIRIKTVFEKGNEGRDLHLLRAALAV
jgi:hypothetical protein